MHEMNLTVTSISIIVGTCDSSYESPMSCEPWLQFYIVYIYKIDKANYQYNKRQLVEDVGEWFYTFGSISCPNQHWGDWKKKIAKN
jgi:hypothetical protein